MSTNIQKTCQCKEGEWEREYYQLYLEIHGEWF